MSQQTEPQGIWARAHVADCIEYLLTMLVSYYAPEEAHAAGIEPEERFSITTNNGELQDDTFVVTDHLAPAECPDEFLVTRDQMDDPEWGIPDMLQDAWNEVAAMPPRAKFGAGFPVRDVPDNRHPALFWLRAKLSAALQREYPYLVQEGEAVSVEPCLLGYVVYLQREGTVMTVLHEEVRSQIFDPRTVLFLMTDARSISDFEEQRQQTARRRRRRMNLLVCGVRPVRKGKKTDQPSNWIPAVERNAMKTKDFTRTLPKPIVVTGHVNGKPVRALIDTGSMADFLSTTVMDQLGLRKEILAKPLPVQLAVHGSRSKINCCVSVDFKYQDIECRHRFDVVNLDNYDMILGTPFLFQHKVAIGLNPTRISVGSAQPVEIQGEDVAVITSAAADLLDDELEKLRDELRRDADDLCQDGARAALPPIRDVNHAIPLIDEKKVYSWRPSKCPDALRTLWHEKKKAYLESGRWKLASGTNASPMLMIPKPAREDGILRLRTVVDKRQQNANTQKLTAPLPDIDGILRNVVKHKYRSLIDGKDAYEQIRVVPEHVPRTLFTTPDGTMVSLVLQQGDINGPAMYQAVMNHIFAPYIGVFMDVYLDDIVIYSDTIEEHMKHVRLMFDVLRRQKFFLGADKMNFFASKLKILGHVIDEKGIAMDPHKVDSVVNWKVPTNKSLLSSFLGAVGFLAPDCASGYISQGENLTTAKVVTFWSGKFNSAQQNYPVHEQELLAIVESLKRFRPLLYGTKFRICTDHKALEYLMGQKNLSPRQHRWLDVLNEFNFTVHYIPGETNILADALSRIYSDEPLGIERARSEYVGEDGAGVPIMSRGLEVLRPVYTGAAAVIDFAPRRSARLAVNPKPEGAYAETKRRPKATVEDVPEDSKAEDGPAAVNEAQAELTEGVPSVLQADNADGAEHSPILDSVVSSASELGMELPGCLRGRYVEDPYFRKIVAKSGEFPHFQYIDGLLFKLEGNTHLLCVPDIRIGSRKLREVLLRHAHSVLAHLGSRKTLDYIRVPRRPWQYIAIDFVGPLPASENRHGEFDMICVIIDQLTSMVHLVPTVQTYGAAEIAEVVFEHVYKLHGLPERIISDRDTLFTTYHPQTDGATERANRTMTQMLRQCVRPDQKDWVQKLPAIELAMNTARSDTTGFSPFYLNYGQMPRSLVWSSESEYPGVRKFAQRMKEAIMAAHDAIISARIGQVVQANKRRRQATFQKDDLVYVSTKNLNLPKGRARKLAPKYLGPFRISKVIAEGVTYQLDLSAELKARGIHNAFHASLLRPHFPNDDRRFPGRQFHQLPGFGEQPREWAVDRIVSHAGKGADAEFEVQWSTGDVTWVPYADIRHLQALTEYFEAMDVTNIRQLGKEHAPVNDASPELQVNALTVEFKTLYAGRRQPVWEHENEINTGHGEDEGHNVSSSPRSTHSLSCMSDNPRLYTAEDRLKWERYAKAFTAWLAKPTRDTYPGNPPAGYYEAFKVQQPYAPGPREYSDLVSSVLAPPAAPVPSSIPQGVSMSTEAFSAFLNHRSGTHDQIIQFAQRERAAVATRAYVPQWENGHGFGRGGWRGGGRGGGRGGWRGGGRGGGRPFRTGRGGGRPLLSRLGGPSKDTADDKPRSGKSKGKWRYRKRGNRRADQDEEEPQGESLSPERDARSNSLLRFILAVLGIATDDESADAEVDNMDVDRETAPAQEIPEDDEDDGPEIGEGDYELL
uniref:RNA-directed DNA polymerase n=1 Tax=Ganoderma boninense TaxID=34458 RepID=A0A5K1JTR2_9APHY|nr:Uncharacterized protein [Ganoderma boninense]